MLSAPRIGLYLVMLLIAAQCNLPFANSASTTGDNASETPTPTAQSTTPPTDLLDAVQKRGYLKVAVRVWPDSSFSPPLFRNAFGALDGYEVDLAWAIANGLNTGLEMAENAPQQIAGGNWGGEWDIALAWLPVTDNARQVLIFSEPYAYDSGGLVVHRDNETITGLDNLGGKRVGVPAHTVYQQMLSGQAPSVKGKYIAGAIPPNLEVIPYNQDGNAFRDLAKGNDATLDAAIHSSLAFNQTVQAEFPLKMVADNLFPAPIGIAFDRSGLPSERLREAINNTLMSMKQDGSLAELSVKWYRKDISSPAPR